MPKSSLTSAIRGHLASRVHSAAKTTRRPPATFVIDCVESSIKSIEAKILEPPSFAIFLRQLTENRLDAGDRLLIQEIRKSFKDFNSEPTGLRFAILREVRKIDSEITGRKIRAAIQLAKEGWNKNEFIVFSGNGEAKTSITVSFRGVLAEKVRAMAMTIQQPPNSFVTLCVEGIFHMVDYPNFKVPPIVYLTRVMRGASSDHFELFVKKILNMVIPSSMSKPTQFQQFLLEELKKHNGRLTPATLSAAKTNASERLDEEDIINCFTPTFLKVGTKISLGIVPKWLKKKLVPPYSIDAS